MMEPSKSDLPGVKSNWVMVWQEVGRRFDQIGMVLPSSRFLADAMVKPVRTVGAPRRILEVGPGTGPMTRQILKSMTERDTLLICEVNGPFLQKLKDNLSQNPDFIRHKSRIEFFLGPVQELKAELDGARFDVIVSSLPFLNFTPEMVEELFRIYGELLVQDGVLSTCEYIGLRQLGLIFRQGSGKARLKGVDQVLKKWKKIAREQGAYKRDVALLNFPPAFAVQYSYTNDNAPGRALTNGFRKNGSDGM